MFSDQLVLKLLSSRVMRLQKKQEDATKPGAFCRFGLFLVAGLAIALGWIDPCYFAQVSLSRLT
jgi:hypothetical protein